MLKSITFLCLFLFSLGLTGCSGQRQVVQVGQTPNPAYIYVPAELDVYEISGEKVSSPKLHSGHYTIKTQSGRQEFVVQYIQNWNTVDDIGQIVRWPSMSIVADLKAGKAYQLNYMRPKNYGEALALRKKPRIWLTNSSGLQVAANMLPYRKDGLTPEILRERPKGKYHTQNVPAKTTMAPPSVDISEPSPESEGVLQQLKYWWNRASKKERQAFWNWLGPQ